LKSTITIWGSKVYTAQECDMVTTRTVLSQYFKIAKCVLILDSLAYASVYTP